MRSARFLFLSALFILFLSGCDAFQKGVSTEGIPQVNDFELESLSGSRVSLSDYRGKKSVLLVFWTTWCPYCRFALNSLKDERRYFNDRGVELLAINVGESLQKVTGFVEGAGIDFTVLLDRNSQVSDNYDVLGVPTYFLIGKFGKVVFSGNRFSKIKLQELNLE